MKRASRSTGTRGSDTTTSQPVRRDSPMSSLEMSSLDAIPSLVDRDRDRVDILGVRVRRWNLTQTLDAAEECIRRGERRYAVFINVYNVIESRRDASYRQALNEADFPM